MFAGILTRASPDSSSLACNITDPSPPTASGCSGIAWKLCGVSIINTTGTPLDVDNMQGRVAVTAGHCIVDYVASTGFSAPSIGKW